MQQEALSLVSIHQTIRWKKRVMFDKSISG
jgi:hypothetical protein